MAVAQRPAVRNHSGPHLSQPCAIGGWRSGGERIRRTSRRDAASGCENPTGPWPRLFADVTARRLDLSLVTSTFAIGSITGRLDADLNGLELFNWSPVAFDARLYSTPGDKSRKVISQKAVTSISNVGGGGGGVTAALQSGVLRFFDDFRYDRIGIACQLRNEVCLMSGIEPAGMGYYLVKGRGLPRIDIIGNQGRVAWPQLLAQIAGGMQTAPVVR